ncbi:hypothetical protein Bca101_081675 [Brassica carinata]
MHPELVLRGINQRPRKLEEKQNDGELDNVTASLSTLHAIIIIGVVAGFMLVAWTTPLSVQAISMRSTSTTRTPARAVAGEEEAVIMCEDCNGKGWLLCDFCKGQKTNVKSENKKIYRRCPTCRAVGYVLCKRCKVFKCVTFPNPEDGEELLF